MYFTRKQEESCAITITACHRRCWTFSPISDLTSQNIFQVLSFPWLLISWIIIWNLFSTAMQQDVSKRKKFFEDYARSNGFNPQNPENWYRQTAMRIKNQKVSVHSLFFSPSCTSANIINRVRVRFCFITMVAYHKHWLSCFLTLDLTFQNITVLVCWYCFS